MADTRAELIKKLEKATGPDRAREATQLRASQPNPVWWRDKFPPSVILALIEAARKGINT